ncbi:MAG: hypothetical protein RIE08_04485 [Acidimicrobiales bacterium]
MSTEPDFDPHPDPGSQVHRLHAAATTLDLVGPDLFDVTFGRTQVAQRIYVAVRDEVWNTIPGSMSDLRVEQGPDDFTVTFTMRHVHGPFDFSWRGTVEGTPDSRVTFTMDGEAHSPFRYAKIGFNIHHRLEDHLGRRFHATGGAEETAGVFPAEVDPQLLRDGVLTAMFPPFDRLRCDLPDDVAVTFELDGDLFETQDHRNWADANFKTYGTPLAAGFPMDAEPGQKFHQAVTLVPEGRPIATEPSTGDASFPASIIDVSPRPATGRLPDLGHSVSGNVDTSAGNVALLRRLQPAHLRVDVDADDRSTDTAEQLTLCAEAGAPVELAVRLSSETSDDALDSLAGLVQEHGVDVARLLVFARAEGFRDAGCTPPDLIARVRDRIAARLGGAPVVGGTDQFFSEITRTPPVTEGLDGIAYALNPQVHACDDRSLIDNAQTVRYLAQSSAVLGDDLPVHVSTVSLLGPDGPFPAGPPPGDHPAPNVDPRQGTAFCAAWALGFVTSAAHGGVTSATCFDLRGGRGLIADVSPGSTIASPAARPGDLFPAFHLFEELATWTDRDVIDASPAQEERIFALFGPLGDGSRRLLVANGNDHSRWIRLAGVDATSVTLRILDDRTAGSIAGVDAPQAASLDETRPVLEGELTVALAPYASMHATWG